MAGAPVDRRGGGGARLGRGVRRRRHRGPRGVRRALARQVRETTQLDCTVGIGENKLQAKIGHRVRQAYRRFRPDVRGELVRGARRPADRARCGASAPETAKKLAGLGIGTVSDLATADPDALAAVFGPMTGPWLVLLACGRGDAEVDDFAVCGQRATAGRRRSSGTSLYWSQVAAEVARIAGLLAVDLASEPQRTLRIVVKVRYAPFITETHGVTLAEPSSDPAVIAQAAAEALAPVHRTAPGAAAGRARPVREGRPVRAVLAIPAAAADLAEGGVEGSGWRSAVTVNPQRSYSRRARSWSRSPTGGRCWHPAAWPSR